MYSACLHFLKGYLCEETESDSIFWNFCSRGHVYKRFLSFFADFLWSQHIWLYRFEHGLTGFLQISSAQHLIPPRTSPAHLSVLWALLGDVWRSDCDALPSPTLPAAHITRQKLNSWLKPEICFQLPSHIYPHQDTDSSILGLNTDLKKQLKKI